MPENNIYHSAWQWLQHNWPYGLLFLALLAIIELVGRQGAKNSNND